MPGPWQASAPHPPTAGSSTDEPAVWLCVRHPIYSGLLLAFRGMSLIIGEWRTLLGSGFFTLSFGLKSRQEEARMREVFPEYEEYRRSPAALVPGVY